MSELPVAKAYSARLVVVVAFSRADNGELVPAYDPMQFDTPGRRHSNGALSRGEMCGRFGLESGSPTCYR